LGGDAKALPPRLSELEICFRYAINPGVGRGGARLSPPNARSNALAGWSGAPAKLRALSQIDGAALSDTVEKA